MPSEERAARMRAVLSHRQFDLQAVVENIHDPHNAAAIFRTCDGFGMATVNLLYTTQEMPDISMKVSGYTKKWLAIREFDDTITCLDALRAEGLAIYATNLDEGARDFRTVDWTRPAAVVFGNEHAGCSAEMLERADEHLYIPMVGMAQSFNVSVSAAILFSEAYRQRSEAGMYEPAWNDRHEAQLAAWIEREEARRLQH